MHQKNNVRNFYFSFFRKDIDFNRISYLVYNNGYVGWSPTKMPDGRLSPQNAIEKLIQRKLK